MNKKYIKIILAIVLVATVGLVSFFGYNEYIYQKIGNCFAEGNYALAETYAESISPSFKDVDKIKNLILAINSFDETNKGDYERTFSRLESFKGFQNENINSVYNNFYFKVFSLMNPSSSVTGTTAVATTEIPVITTETPTVTTETPIQTEALATTQPTTLPTTVTTSATTEDYTSEAVSSSVYQTENHTTEATTQVTTEVTQVTSLTETVYYVESGEVYHLYRDCRTLANSKNVLIGSVPEGRRVCKVCEAR